MANMIISNGIIILISFGLYHLITQKHSSRLITMCGSVEGFHLALVGSMDWFHGVYRTNQWVISYNWVIYISHPIWLGMTIRISWPTDNANFLWGITNWLVFVGNIFTGGFPLSIFPWLLPEKIWSVEIPEWSHLDC